MFNAGRVAEYELRRALLHQLQRLGPSFYRRISTGDIMSRSTNDLTQVRLLLGFGALNSVNTLFALVSALAVTLHISGKLTLASLSTLAMWAFAFARQRKPKAIGDMSGAVQSSIAGVRVVRSFSSKKKSSGVSISPTPTTERRSVSPACGAMFPVMQAITAIETITLVRRPFDNQMSAETVFSALFAAHLLGFLVMLQRVARRRQLETHAEPDIVSGATPAPS